MKDCKTVCEQFLENHEDFQPLVFFGAGLCCNHMLDLFEERGSTLPVAVCDNDTNKQNTFLRGIPVISLEKALNEHPDCYILVTTSMYIAPVVAQLKVKIQEERIISFTPYEFQKIEQFRTFVKGHKLELSGIYEKLADDKSKKTFRSVLMGRNTGDYRYYADVFDENQYFPSDIIHLNDEIFLDIGGYIGDTIEDFIGKCDGNYREIITIEPNPTNFEAINHVVQNNRAIQLITVGVSDKHEKLFLNVSSGDPSAGTFSKENDGLVLEVDTIDSLVNQEVTFIKMDIEGLEMKALRGAMKTIQKYKPTLAICIYHKIEDFVEIPQFILDLNLGYKLYVRHHMQSVNETVLYACISDG